MTVKNKLLWCLYLGAINIAIYALLSYIRSYYPEPLIPGGDYILYGGLLSTMYLTIFVLSISLIFFDKQIGTFFGLDHGIKEVKISDPKTIGILLMSMACIGFIIAPQLINYATKKPIIRLLPEGIIIKNDPLMSWYQIDSIYQGRFMYRTLCIVDKNGTTHRIAEPDMYVNVPTALEQIEMYASAHHSDINQKSLKNTLHKISFY